MTDYLPLDSPRMTVKDIVKLVLKVVFYAIVLILFLAITMVIGLASVISGRDFLVEENAPAWVQPPPPLVEDVLPQVYTLETARTQAAFGD